jgi:hypothetical protein
MKCLNKKDNILSCLSCSPLHILILKQDKHKGYEEYCLSCSPLHILCRIRIWRGEQERQNNILSFLFTSPYPLCLFCFRIRGLWCLTPLSTITCLISLKGYILIYIYTYLKHKQQCI